MVVVVVVVVVVIVIVVVVEVVLVVVVKSSPTPPATQLATGTAINCEIDFRLWNHRNTHRHIRITFDFDF